MTTIAFDGKLLACDGLMLGDECIVCNTSAEKVFRLNFQHSAYLAVAGNYAQGLYFKDLLSRQKKWIDNPTVSHDLDDFHALLVNRLGECCYIDKEMILIPQAIPVAIGSGHMIALGAMAAGANATKAVQIASEYDVHTGGELFTYEVSDLNFDP